MDCRTLLRYTLVCLFSLAIGSLVVSSVLGHPVLLGYVETGSMSPTLEPGDGFVALPMAVGGSIQQGDVVVFESEAEGDDFTTHRVVGKTEQGYVTKGDANPFTDQDSGEPPVKRAQIVATALQIDGHVVVIPHLGTAVEGIRSVLSAVQHRLAGLFGTRSLLGVRGLAYLFFAATLVWYAVGTWRAGSTKHRERDTSRTEGIGIRLLLATFAALLVVGATAAMVVPSGPQEYGVVSAEFESDEPTVVPAGESTTVPYPVYNGGVVPTVSFVEPASDGVDVDSGEVALSPGHAANATVTLHAPPEPGYYRRFVVERRYLALLPRPAIRALYGVHPWAPIVAIDALIAVPFYLLGLALAGTGRVKDRSRDVNRSLGARIRRLIKVLY